MLTVLLLSSALGAPPGFQVTRDDVSGCTLMLGEREADGVVPMRAECHWPEVTVAHFHETFAPWDHHDRFFSSVSVSEILEEDGDRLRVRQIHVARGISDREVIIDATRAPLDEGGFRYAWTLASDQVEGGDLIVPARNDGHWEVRPHPEGGVAVVHQLAYDPAGRVPGFVVRWFQTSGLAEIVTDLHTVMMAE